MKIKYPIGINSDKDRYSYLYKLQNILLLEHNQKGITYQDKKITLAEWSKYRYKKFNPRNELISNEINFYRRRIKAEAKNSELISASLNDITMEE